MLFTPVRITFMKKDLVTHFLYTFAFILLVSFIRRWLNLSYYPFWIGSLIGMVLPDIDYLIYIYALKPQKDLSQEAVGLIEKRSFTRSWDLLTKERSQHTDLIFHTAYFQIIFIIFSFLIVTSSGSTFGIGVVLAFLLHLIIDQANDLFELNGINNWFAKMNMILSQKQQRWYLLSQIAVLSLFGLLF